MEKRRDTPTSTLRLVLSEEQTAAIRESGIRFAVIHPSSWPAPHAGRWVIDCFDCKQPAADAAVRVALGHARAVAIPQKSDR
jgi:hypothetical protein